MDIKLGWRGATADLVLGEADLQADDGLETAVLISLFTDRRARDDDALPYADADRRGWWGDSFADRAGDQIGSRLWLLRREKQLSAVVTRAREYAEEALQWLLDDGIAQRVEVTAELLRPGVLALHVRIVRPSGAELNQQYQYVWERM